MLARSIEGVADMEWLRGYSMTRLIMTTLRTILLAQTERDGLLRHISTTGT